MNQRPTWPHGQSGALFVFAHLQNRLESPNLVAWDFVIDEAQHKQIGPDQRWKLRSGPRQSTCREVNTLSTYYGKMAGTECTVQRDLGDFCSKKAHPGLPFPICLDHAIKLHAAMTEAVRHEIRYGNGAAGFTRERRALDKQSVVYYIRLTGSDLVKIGYTTNLDRRRQQLRADRKEILATEPGGPTIERKRHAQFAAERVDERENFRMSKRLMDHIASLAK